jgi:tRNA-2-methylthio-N6-dimethylallyladenosine synthase
VNEVRELHEKGYKEVTLLGQNVDSYLWYGGGAKMDFNKLSSIQQASSVNFAQLLEKVALVSPEMRFRFSTSHPQDMTDQVLETMAKYENICDYIHLPVQSGNTRILEMMNRGYTREWYMQRIDSIKKIIPDCAISQDIISSFCSETEDEHKDTLSLMDYVKFDYGFMFKYSERPNTKAARQFEDDVPEEVKSRRLTEIIEKQRAHSMEHNQSKIGKTFKVLVEGVSKKSDEHLFGRTTHNSVAVFPKKHYKAGDYVQVKITSCNSATLIGESVEV